MAAYADIVREIAAEDGLAFKMALIHSEQEKSFLLEKALRIFDDELVAVMSICALTSRMQGDRLPALVDCLRRQCAAAGACDFDA